MTSTPAPSPDLHAAPDAVAELLRLLEPEPAGDDAFVAGHLEVARTSRHVFGGMVAAQAFVAASRTVDADRPGHSLHAYFLRPGDPDVPVELRVERTRDGRSFSHRRVSCVQHGRAIMEMSCSFARDRPGVSHQVASPLPAGGPGDALSLDDLLGTDAYASYHQAFELRPADLDERLAGRPLAPGGQDLMWVRVRGGSTGDPVLDAALLVYASDMTILEPIFRAHGRSTAEPEVGPATIDHAMWFHQPVAAGEWWLLTADSPWAGHGRGVARGRVHDAAGTLVAEVAQEGLLNLA